MILLLFVYLHFFTDVLFSCFFLFAYFFFSSTLIVSWLNVHSPDELNGASFESVLLFVA